MPRLERKVAIVTGGARGIGRAIALGMAHEGACVVIGDRLPSAAQQTAHGIEGAGGAALAVAVDVAVRAEVEALAATTVARFGTPDILVTCAGITHTSDAPGFLDLTDVEWAAVLDVNLRGTFLCAQVVARQMVADGRPGSIITVSSIGASRPTVGYPAYQASKGGVEGLTRALAVNLAPYGIRANGLAPGYILTDMTRDALEPEIHATIANRIPLRHMGDPADLVGAAVYLASDEARYTTGQILCIDGGAVVLGWTPAPPLARHVEPSVT